MRWAIAVGMMIAGCGRIAFDPLDDGGDANGDSGRIGSNSAGGDGGTDGGTPQSTRHYIKGGSSSQSGLAGSMTQYNASQSQTIWFKRITSGTTINVFFTQPTTSIDLKWAAYREIDQ